MHHKIKKAKKDFYTEKVEQANSRNFWEFRRWTTGTRQYPSPAISRGPDRAPAITHEEKCEALWTILFPTPEADMVNSPPMNMDPCPEDMQHHKIKQGEVRDALFTAALA